MPGARCRRHALVCGCADVRSCGSGARLRLGKRGHASLAGGLPGLRILPAWLGSRPASASALRSRNSIWALVLRNSSAAHRARASCTAGSSRSRIPLRSLTVPGPSASCTASRNSRPAGWPTYRTETMSRLETIAVAGSSSSSTTPPEVAAAKFAGPAQPPALDSCVQLPIIMISIL